jgi:hypothetical protein
MSKWSSVRSKPRVETVRHVFAAVAALFALSALGACDRNNQSDQRPSVRASTVVEPETRVDTVPQEEPGVARSTWRAANDSARNITGNLRVSIEGVRGGPVIFAFANGVTLRGQPIAQTPADNRSGVGGQSLAAVVGGDPRVDAFIYRVENETVAQSASHGGLCGADLTRYMAVSEFVASDGRWVFKIASFKGDRQPGTSGADPGYCSSFGFQAQ